MSWATGLVLVAMLVLGGGPTEPSIRYAIEFFAGAALLAALVARPGSGPMLPWLVLVFVAAVLALPAFQLIPLPSDIAQAAPGRATASLVRRLAGAGDRWFPITLTPSPTVQTLFSLVLLLGLFLAVLRLDLRGVRLLVGAVLAVQVATIVIGVLQLTSGGTLFDFYHTRHRFNLLGFFANRNHAAVFLAAAVPLAVGLVASGKATARQLLSVVGLVTMAVFVAVLGTVSRAGLMLVAGGALLSLLLLVPLSGGRARLIGGASVAGAGLLGVLLFTSTAVSQVLDRYADVGDDLRWRFYVRTWSLVPQFLPWGGGLGSFVPIYAANEQLTDLKPTFVNNAHNDMLELLLEAGWWGLSIELLLLAMLAWGGIRLLRRPPSADRALGLAGLIVALLLVAHSFVDYPLRRMACAALFTVALALMVRPLRRAPVGAHAAG